MTQTWSLNFSSRQSHLMASPAVCALTGTMAISFVKYTNPAKPPTP